MDDERSLSKLCYRCGKQADTKDHVVSRCFYPLRPSVQLITVPACRSCNEAVSKDEEYLRTLMVASAVNSRVAQTVWQQKVEPSLRRDNYDGLRKLFASGMKEVFLPGPGGYLPHGLMKGDARRMDRAGDKIVRGLYYSITGRVLPESASLRFHWQPREWLQDMALKARVVNIDPDVFTCRFAITSQSLPELSIWWMRFYRQFMYVVTVRSDETALTPDIAPQAVV